VVAEAGARRPSTRWRSVDDDDCAWVRASCRGLEVSLRLGEIHLGRARVDLGQHLTGAHVLAAFTSILVTVPAAPKLRASWFAGARFPAAGHGGLHDAFLTVTSCSRAGGRRTRSHDDDREPRTTAAARTASA